MSNDKSVQEVERWFAGEPPLLSIRRAAELLSCSERQIHRYMDRGQLEAIKFGVDRSAKRSITRASLVNFVACNRVRGVRA